MKIFENWWFTIYIFPFGSEMHLFVGPFMQLGCQVVLVHVKNQGGLLVTSNLDLVKTKI